MADTSFLHWPFFEDRHRQFAERIDRWAGDNLGGVDHGDVDSACRELVAKLGEAGCQTPAAWEPSCWSAKPTLSIGMSSFASSGAQKAALGPRSGRKRAWQGKLGRRRCHRRALGGLDPSPERRLPRQLPLGRPRATVFASPKGCFCQPLKQNHTAKVPHAEPNATGRGGASWRLWRSGSERRSRKYG